MYAAGQEVNSANRDSVLKTRVVHDNLLTTRKLLVHNCCEFVTAATAAAICSSNGASTTGPHVLPCQLAFKVLLHACVYLSAFLQRAIPACGRMAISHRLNVIQLQTHVAPEAIRLCILTPMQVSHSCQGQAPASVKFSCPAVHPQVLLRYLNPWLDSSHACRPSRPVQPPSWIRPFPDARILGKLASWNSWG